MRRWYKVLLPTVLFVLWLLLNESMSAGQVVVGLVLALWLGYASSRLRPLRSRPHKLWLLFGLARRVVVDIIRSNFEVARLILARRRPYTPGYVHIPLDLHDPHGRALLGCILTYTPGTVWVDVSNNVLTLHVLDLENEEFWIELVKTRYERTLMEVFQ
ncbi:Na+/H+ antiporter subunit E [Bordetella sp. 02P26C-1]|uniref:Na+/H+ antiporter subunit E n=1 Tax=Bordetella sp. 02P26C-1 TaxID=2683195 RepID=UPI0013541DCB|nr:Na+/H+ antiporter subunit E [Bordetella sp. 02P26C-1]MVW79993.1 Na+/H+ antiporter subunit E [Bordetella sp. 02P26C-1]